MARSLAKLRGLGLAATWQLSSSMGMATATAVNQPREFDFAGGESENAARWVDRAAQVKSSEQEAQRQQRWVFLGCPGVGKGTYASRLAKHLDIPHISTGDLVRAEVKKGSIMASQLEALMKQGKLVPDEVIFELLTKRLEDGARIGEKGFILDGFPRTTCQATILDEVTNIDLVLNLRLREEVLVSKCLGRRTCGECGGNFNIADIHLKGENGLPDIVMPPLSPPKSCLEKMVVRSDDTEEIVKRRLQNYWNESQPVEDYYRRKQLLLDFDIVGGIPETWPRLLSALSLDHKAESEPLPKAA